LVSQSTKVQFIKRLPGFSFDLENKFNYAETKKKRNENLFAKICEAPTPTPKQFANQK